MLSFEDTNVLGQLIDTSFGHSSTGEKGHQASSGRSIKCNISSETGEDVLVVKYLTVVNLHGHESYAMNPQHPGAKAVSEESIKLTNDYISNLKKEFKKATDRALTLKELNSNDSIELVNYNIFSPNRTVYYRRNSTFSIKA